MQVTNPGTACEQQQQRRAQAACQSLGLGFRVYRVRMTVQKQHPFTLNPKLTLPLPQKSQQSYPTRLRSHGGSGIGVLVSRGLDLGVVGGWGAYSTSSVLGACNTSSVLGTYGTCSVPGASQTHQHFFSAASTFSVLPKPFPASCAATAASSSSSSSSCRSASHRIRV